SNDLWSQRYRDEAARNKAARTDARFCRELEFAREWTDLDLFLRGLQQLGARPLLISAPIHQAWYENWGISAAAQKAYYRKFRNLAEARGVPVVDFADHAGDLYFQRDYWGHLSPKGWVCFARALDAFRHERLPAPADLGNAEEPGASPAGGAGPSDAYL